MGAGKTRTVIRELGPIGTGDNYLTDEEKYARASSELMEIDNEEFDRHLDILSKYQIEDIDDVYKLLDDVGLPEVSLRLLTHTHNAEPLDRMSFEKLKKSLKNEDEETYEVMLASIVRSTQVAKAIQQEYKKLTGKDISDGFAMVTDYRANGTSNVGGVTLEVNDNRNYVTVKVGRQFYDIGASNVNLNALSNALPTDLGASKVTSHEFGHALEQRIRSNPQTASVLKEFNSTIKKSGYSGVSRYGNLNEHEAFAEAFSLYTHGVQKASVGNNYYTEFKTLMHKTGMSSMWGIANQHTANKPTIARVNAHSTISSQNSENATPKYNQNTAKNTTPTLKSAAQKSQGTSSTAPKYNQNTAKNKGSTSTTTKQETPKPSTPKKTTPKKTTPKKTTPKPKTTKKKKPITGADIFGW